MSLRKISILTCLLFSPCFGNAPSASNQPNIKILAEQMDCDQSQNTCVASGDASAEKLNDPKTKILKADKITAHFSKEGETSSMKPDELKADGNVRFKLDDIFVQGDRGDYDVGAEVAKVYDNVKITNGENQISGKTGEVNLKTGKYAVRGDGERVEALIYTKEEKANKDRPAKD